MAVTLLTNLPSPANQATFETYATNIWPQLNTSLTEFNNDVALLNLNSTASTSTTSVALGTGSKSLTVQTGKSYLKNMPVRIASTATLGAYMDGYVDTYTSGTGALVVNVVGFLGSGTLASWNVYLSPSLTYSALLNDLLVTGVNKKIGYGTGAGLTYTQATSKSTAVAVTTRTGVITMNNASLAANTKITFLVSLTGLTNNEHALVSLRGGFANQESYIVTSRATSGGFQVILWNTSAGALAEAVEVLYTIVSGSAS